MTENLPIPIQIGFIAFLIVTMICPTDTRNVAIPYTTLRQLSFVPRGGSAGAGKIGDSINDGITATTSSDGQKWIGVIDLRPTPGPDSMIFLQDGSIRNGDDEKGCVGFDNIVHQALFPSASQDEMVPVSEDDMDQQAAASHSIGSTCSTVYLIIAYDFDNGKTMLHRSFGGTKLMAFVDGVRSRRHRETGDAAMNQREEESSTKLVLVFVPSSSSSATALLSNLPSSPTTSSENLLLSEEQPLQFEYVIALDLTRTNTEWDATGAKFLVDRLSEAFAFGGEEYQNMEPFRVDMVGAFGVGEEIEQTDEITEADNAKSDIDMAQVVLRLIERSLRKNKLSDTTRMVDTCEEIHDLVRSTYEAAGGVGSKIHFQSHSRKQI